MLKVLQIWNFTDNPFTKHKLNEPAVHIN